VKRIFRNHNLHEILKGFKTIILSGAVFSLLFITLLRKPDSTGSGFLALSVFSLNEGRSADPRQAGRADKKMHEAFFNEGDGRPEEAKGHPRLYSPKYLLTETGGTSPETFRRSAIITSPLPMDAGPSSTQGGPAVLSRITLGEGGLTRFDTGSPPAVYDWLDTLIGRIQQVESGSQNSECGSEKIPDGDDGRAVGPMQLHRCVVADVNRFYGTEFTDDDRRDIEKSRLIAKLYISYWLNVHKEEICSRIWVGGPRGWRKKSTDAYWRKIQGVK